MHEVCRQSSVTYREPKTESHIDGGNDELLDPVVDVEDQRVIIRFLYNEGVTPDEIHARLALQFADDTCS
jgi:hypothetical protein